MRPSPQINHRNLDLVRENSMVNTVKINRESSSNGNSATATIKAPFKSSNKDKV